MLDSTMIWRRSLWESVSPMRHTHSQMVRSFETSEFKRLDLVPSKISNGFNGIVCIVFNSLVILNGRSC